MTGYAARRRVATVAGAAGAAALTALGAWGLGGHAPDPDTGSSIAATPRRERTVTRTVDVTRHVRAPGRVVVARAPSSSGPVTANAPAAARPSRPAHRPVARHERAIRRPAAGSPSGAARPVATSSGGGYRAFAAATSALAGDMRVARSGSAVALDGHAPDTADELGALVDGLPAGRTAFARATSLPGDATTTSSSPPAGPASGQDGGRCSTATTAANTDEHGACVRRGPIASAEAHAAAAGAGPLALTGGTSHTESALDDGGERFALVSRALAAPPDVTIAPGTPAEVAIRFLGPVQLLVRAGGTPGSAAAQLGPRGAGEGAPLVEIRTAGSTVRYTAGDVLEGGGRTVRFGPVSVLLGGAPHAWRGSADASPLVGADGTFASAAADVLTVRVAGAPALVLGHVEASVAVPRGGVRC